MRDSNGNSCCRTMGWHLKAFSCATTEVVYAIRFSTVVLLQLRRQGRNIGYPGTQ
jgi:hypothetical protein